MSEELERWVDEHKKQGFSDLQIEQTLRKHGHDSESIQAVLGEQHMPTPLYLTVLIGLSTFCFVLTILTLSVSSFLGLGWVIPFIMLVFCGLLGGFVIHIVAKEGKVSSLQYVLLGILAPILTTYVLYYGLIIIEKMMQLESFETQGVGSGLHPIFSITPLPALITALLFYITANSFVIVHLIKEKNTKELIWYLLAFVLLFCIWIFGVLFASPITHF